MASQRITVGADFETLIARAGFTKASLARAAKVNRGVIFRALNPDGYAVSGALRKTTARNIAHAYAERAELDRDRAFARLFVVTGESQHGSLAHGCVDAAPAGESVMDRDTPQRAVQPRHQEPSAVLATALKKPANLRLDAERWPCSTRSCRMWTGAASAP